MQITIPFLHGLLIFYSQIPSPLVSIAMSHHTYHLHITHGWLLSCGCQLFLRICHCDKPHNLCFCNTKPQVVEVSLYVGYLASSLAVINFCSVLGSDVVNFQQWSLKILVFWAHNIYCKLCHHCAKNPSLPCTAIQARKRESLSPFYSGTVGIARAVFSWAWCPGNVVFHDPLL